MRFPNTIKFSLLHEFLTRPSSLHGQCHYLRFSTSSSIKNITYPLPSEPSEPSDPIDLETRVLKNVGVTEFASNHAKITGAVKKEAHDFQVHEIDQSGKKAVLTDLTMPPDSYGGAWGEVEKGYIECTMFKDSVDHYAASTHMIRGLRTNWVSFAGRKDKRALTCQRVTLPISVNRYLLRNSLKWPKIKLGNFSPTPVPRPLKSGYLRGNSFKILVRDVQTMEGSKNNENFESVLQTGVKNLNEIGFINYFGLQRFSAANHKVGLAILKKDWEEVYKLIFTLHANDNHTIREVKESWHRQKDPNKILHLFYARSGALTQQRGVPVPDYLLKTHRYQETGLEGTFRKVPKDQRILYLSGALNCIWNRMVSLRVEKYGMEMLPGDFIFAEPPYHLSSILACDDDPPDDLLSYSRGEHKWLLTGEYKPVRKLTQEDINSGIGGKRKFSIYDVLVPCLGSKITRIDHPIMDGFCKTVMKEFGLDPNCMAHLFTMSDASDGGFYRHMFCKPQTVTYKLIPYDDSTDFREIMPSDLDILIRDGKFEDYSGRYPQNEETDNNNLVKDKMGAILEFALPASSYATMLIRELLYTSNFRSPH